MCASIACAWEEKEGPGTHCLHMHQLSQISVTLCHGQDWAG